MVTLRASCGAVYCNRSCPFAIGRRCLCVGMWVSYHDNSKFACIDPHETGFVGKRSDHLQLIKFWPSRAPRKGVCQGAKLFGSTLLQEPNNWSRLGTDVIVTIMQCSACVSLSTFSLPLRWGHNNIVFIKLVT